MNHRNRHIIFKRDGKSYLKPCATLSFETPLFPEKDSAIRQAEEDAHSKRHMHYVACVEGGYIVVGYGTYAMLFAEKLGDDVVYRAEP